MSAAYYKSQAAVEPEMEVHSVEEEDGKNNETVSDWTQEIQRQKAAIMKMRNAEFDQTASFLDELDLNNSTRKEEKTHKPESGLLRTWSDDDSELKDVDLGSFHDSIVAIRKEASKLDAALALDQLDTLKEEIRTLHRELNNRTEEVEELRSLLDLKDDRLGTLELERDLYKADTVKLKNDLAKLKAQTSPNNKAPAQDTKLPAAPTKEKVLLAPDAPGSLHHVDSVKVESNRKDQPEDMDEGDPFQTILVVTPDSVPVSRKPKPLDPPSLAHSSPSTDSSTYFSDHSDLISRDAGIEVLEKPRLCLALPSRALRSENHQRRSKGRSILSFCHGASPKKERSVAEPDESEIELTSGLSLQDHVQDMSQRMKSSIETSERLRSRLAMVSRYYENVLKQLQESLAKAKAERSRMEADLVDQITSMDMAKREAVHKLETKLLEKEAEIRMLKSQY
jgi:hypothetical protein